MKSEQLDKYIGKKVRITFTTKVCLEGFLGHGDYIFGKDGWFGKGYHLRGFYSPLYNSCGFKKSHVKSIDEIS